MPIGQPGGVVHMNPSRTFAIIASFIIVVAGTRYATRCTSADAVNDVYIALAAAGLSLSILPAFESMSNGVNAKIVTSFVTLTNAPNSGID